MNRRFFVLALLLCFVVSAASAQGAAPAKQDPAVVREYLAKRAKIAARIEKQWRDDFEKTGRLPGEDESKDASETPPLDAPAKEHLGKSNPDTLIPQLQKELTRLVKLSSNRELDREEKREAKKQATRVRISLSYIKRHKEEFRKAVGDPKQRLEKMIADMHNSPLTEYFEIANFTEDRKPVFVVGRFGEMFVDEKKTANTFVIKVVDRLNAIVSIFNPERTNTSPGIHLRGVSTKEFERKGKYYVDGFFYVSGLIIYEAGDGGDDFVLPIVERFDPVAAMKSVAR